MASILDCLANVSTCTTFSVLRALSAFEAPWTSDLADVVVVDSGASDGWRILHLRCDETPLVRSFTSGHQVTWTVENTDRLPLVYRDVLTAIGGDAAGGALDADAFDDRLCELDSILMLSHALTAGVEPGGNVADVTTSVLALATQWADARLKSFNDDETSAAKTAAYDRACDEVSTAARTLLIEHPWALHALKLLPDPRGAILELTPAASRQRFQSMARMPAWAKPAPSRTVGASAPAATRAKGPRLAVHPSAVSAVVLAALKTSRYEGDRKSVV